MAKRKPGAPYSEVWTLAFSDGDEISFNGLPSEGHQETIEHALDARLARELWGDIRWGMEVYRYGEA